jgi:hypothetical protein
VVRSAEGAGEPCEGAARTLLHRHAFDWLGRVVNPTAQASPERLACQSGLPVWFLG